MIIKIRIRTPQGGAKGIEPKLRKAILGIKTVPLVAINESDSEVTWIVDETISKCLKIQRSVSKFDYMLKGVVNNRYFKRMAIKAVGLAGVAELDEMLMKHTTIEVMFHGDFQRVI